MSVDAAPADDDVDRLPHRDVGWFTKTTVAVYLCVSNVVGAAVVLVLGGWVLPVRDLVADVDQALARNLTLFTAYVVLALVVGAGWGRSWVRVPAPPPPGADEEQWHSHRARVRRVVLRAPIRLAVVQAVPWIVAVAVFGSLNAQWSWLLAGVVACLVALGGVTTVAVAYRLSDLALRREVARVLAVDPPTGGRTPGVRTRSMGAWLLGTGVPLLGLVLLAVASLAVPTVYSVRDLGLAVLVLALVALGVGFLLTALTSTSIATPVVEVSQAMSRIERGDLDVTVPVSDTTELGALQAGFNTMVDGLRERDRVRALFGRQVGEDVAQAALDHGVELGGETREVAVLFVDLVGSTQMALDLPPHDVVAFLNVFLSEVVDVVEAHGGWINKFEGDAALAVFGAPGELPDAAGAALAAGRHMAARLQDIRVDLTDGVSVTGVGPGGRPRGRVDDGARGRAVEVGIGISAGPAVAGNIGDHRRYEYTVIGDPVNEASRLCDLAKTLPGSVAASGRALDRARPDEVGRWRSTGRHRLRGRRAPTVVAVPADPPKT